MNDIDIVKSEYTAGMPEDYVAQTASDVVAMPPEQQREYAEAFEPDLMGFCGKEGI